MATDYDCWRDTEIGRVCVADVLETFKKNVDKVTRLVIASVPRIAAQKWDTTFKALKVSYCSKCTALILSLALNVVSCGMFILRDKKIKYFINAFWYFASDLKILCTIIFYI